MKIFDSNNSPWREKVNFVDRNNLLVGYSMSACCCENFGWFIAESITPYGYDKLLGRDFSEAELEPYVFDGGFIEVASNDLDEGGQVAFRMIAEGKPDLYLHLYNAHNGYYSHGFEFQNGDETITEGSL